MEVKFSQAFESVKAFLKAGLVPLLVGSPGCGKSQLAYAVAKEYNLELIDLRLAQCDPCDLAGFPTVEGGKADYVPMKHFPIEGDPLPEGKAGWLLFLDELTSALPSIQAASYKLILDRMVGSHHLHKNVAIMGAGNKETDNAIVQPMSTALQSRLVHLELMVEPQEWINWANAKGIDHRITSYINWKPGVLYTFKPDHTDKTYACPRTWEFADRLLKQNDIDSPIMLPMLCGTLSEGVTREFMVFTKIHKELPTINQILKSPESIKVPDEPSILYALVGAISHHTTKETIDDLMKFMERLPMEFQVVCLRDMRGRHGNVTAWPAVQKWISKNASQLF